MWERAEREVRREVPGVRQGRRGSEGVEFVALLESVQDSGEREVKAQGMEWVRVSVPDQECHGQYRSAR